VFNITAVWVATARRNGVLADKEVMRQVRSECEAMTRRTPFVSFHVILVPVASASRGAWLQMETVDHIGVSVSLSASASGVATAIVQEASSSKVEECNANHEPVVYAEAVATSRGYHSVVNEDNVEMV
jgi:hypothetical protein